MQTLDDSPYDRHLRLAELYTGDSQSQALEKFTGARVLVMVADSAYSTNTGRLMLSTVLNLIARFCPKIDVAAPGYLSIVEASLLLLRQIERSDDAEFRPVSAPDFGAYRSILQIGRSTTYPAQAICLDSSGWMAAIEYGSAPAPLPPAPDESIPFGAIIAACLGAAEVFKRLLQAAPAKVASFEPAVLSAFDYSVAADASGNNSGPAIPQISLPQTLLAGAGAIGNAFTYALRQVPDISGSLVVVDKKPIAMTGWNRCIETMYDDAFGPNRSKVSIIERAFSGTGIECTAGEGELEDYITRIHQKQSPRPKVIVSGVDNNEIRGSLQSMWPDLLLEGATRNAGLHVFKYDYYKETACLKCIHPTRPSDATTVSPSRDIARVTGLPEQVIMAALRGEDINLRAEDLGQVTPEYASRLKGQVGQSMCSVLADVSQYSTRPELVPKAATVSFVSVMAGTLVAAELVKWAGGLGSPLETLYIFEAFAPLANAYLQPLEKLSSCECRKDAEIINRYRQSVVPSAR